MSTTTASKQVEVEVLLHERPGIPGVLRLGGRYYDYGAEEGGCWLERLSSGQVYHVRVAGGRPTSCDCPAAKFTRHRGRCKHEYACQAILADALKGRD